VKWEALLRWSTSLAVRQVQAPVHVKKLVVFGGFSLTLTLGQGGLECLRLAPCRRFGTCPDRARIGRGLPAPRDPPAYGSAYVFLT